MARLRRPFALSITVVAVLTAGWLPARATETDSLLVARRTTYRLRPPHLTSRPPVRPPAGAPREAGTVPAGAPSPFNLDRSGLPQNEESVAVCPSRQNVVLGGVNDYRGLALDPTGAEIGASGWQLSLDGGQTVAIDGLLPGVAVGGETIPSQGDPAVATAPDCRLYYASLIAPLEEETPSAVAVYRSSPETLAGCQGGIDPACWPVSRAIASSTSPSRIIDKPWMAVGRSGAAGVVVWVAWAEFRQPDPNAAETSSIRAARCNADLSRCTRSMLISGRDRLTQFADITVGPDGRTYLTWTEIRVDATGTRVTYVPKLRVAPAGSTRFGPARTAGVDRLPAKSVLHADDFRVGTYPKNTVAMVAGRPRIYVTWESCRAVVNDGATCEEPRIRLRYSDDDGRSWTEPRALSLGGDNYFPTIDTDPVTGLIAVAWYTNREDAFHHRQQVEVVSVDPATGKVLRRQLLTPLNEPDGDPLLGGQFIGDYFEIAASGARAYVHFNANYRLQKFAGSGLPVAQQDNYLIVTAL